MIDQEHIPSDWSLIELGDFVDTHGEFITDGDWIESDDMDESGRIGIVQIGQILPDNISFDEVTKYITDEWAETNNCTLCKDNDIIVTRMSPVLGAATVPPESPDFVVPVDVMIIRGLEEPTRSFLAHYFNSPISRLFGERTSKGATRSRISQTNARKLPVPVPPIEEQERIVEIVENQLTAISEITQSISNLENTIGEFEKAIAAFLLAAREDFRSESLIGFPDEDELPNGWELKEISEICRVNAINHNLEEDFPHQSFKYVSVSDIDETHGKIESHKTITGAESPSRAKREMTEGDTIVSTVRPYLRGFAQVPEEYDGEICSTAFAVLTPSESINGNYLFFTVRSPMFVEQLKKEQRGAAYPAVGIRDVKNSKIPVPSLDEQIYLVEKFEKIQNHVQKTRVCIENSNNLLDEYLASLLDHAFKGNLNTKLLVEEDLTGPKTNNRLARAPLKRYED